MCKFLQNTLLLCPKTAKSYLEIFSLRTNSNKSITPVYICKEHKYAFADFRNF
jgi:hypothetical protein